MKRIVVLIDGTWNKEGTAGNTNVATLDIAHRIAANAFIKAEATDGIAPNGELPSEHQRLYRAQMRGGAASKKRLTAKAPYKSGSFPPPALPGLNGRTTLSDTRPIHRHKRC
jgi:hypothetical protein